MNEHAFGSERITGAATWRIVFLVIQAGSSVVLFAVLGQILHRDAFAATAIAQGVLVITQTIGDFGLSQAAVSVLPARIAAGRADTAELVAGAARTYLYAAGLGLGLTLTAALVVPSAAGGPVAVSAPAAAAVIVVAGADGILRAQGEFRRPVLLMAMSELAGFAGVPVALLTHSALWTCTAISAAMTIGAIGAAIVLAAMINARPHASPRPFARASLPLGLTQIFVVLGARIDTLLAGGISGLVAAGTFEGSWRVYQLSQYAAGALATATAPFIANALGAHRHDRALTIVQRLATRLLLVGVVAAVLLGVARVPIAHVLTGSLAAPVQRVVPIFALLCPIAALGLVAFYTLVAFDGQRRFVLLTSGLGAVVNIALAAALAPSMGARGVVIGCAAGQALTSLVLLARLLTVLRTLRAMPQEPPSPPEIVNHPR
ncbi:MAG TPA: MATE family efflux transporter [Solirubrobacteraceae bacterium]|nr:MATE family efflux transporter [Solirubrobacteraceae bacterium]